MYDNAIEAYKTASSLQPINPDPYFKLGLAYRDNKNYSKAAESFEKALKLRRNDHEAHYELGMIYYRNLKNNAKFITESVIGRDGIFASDGCRPVPDKLGCKHA